jgi:precorrin-2 methylase
MRCFQGEFYGREVILADRDCVETGADQIFEHAKDDDVAFLVVGDPLWYAACFFCKPPLGRSTHGSIRCDGW